MRGRSTFFIVAATAFICAPAIETAHAGSSPSLRGTIDSQTPEPRMPGNLRDSIHDPITASRGSGREQDKRQAHVKKPKSVMLKAPPPAPTRKKQPEKLFDQPVTSDPPATSESLDLGTAVNRTLETNGRIKASEDDIGAAQSVVWQQIASFIPVVTASAAAGRDYNSTVTNKRANQRTLGVQLTVPLFTSGQRLFNWRSANSSLVEAGAQAELARNEIALDLISAHINYLSAGRVSELIARNVKTLERLLAAVEAKRRLGFASDTDRAQVLADLSSLKSQIESSIQSRAKARETVASLVGAAVRDRLDIAALERPLSDGVDGLVESAMTSNPEVVAALSASEAARYRSYAAKSGLLPKVTLNAGYNRDYEPVSPDIDPDDWRFEVRGTVPLFNAGAIGEVARTRFLASSAANRAREVRRTVELDVRQLWQDLVAARKQLSLARDRVAQRRQVSSSMEEQYKRGLVSLDIMLDRQRLLTSSEVEMERFEVERAVTVFRLLVASGRFSPAMLETASERTPSWQASLSQPVEPH